MRRRQEDDRKSTVRFRRGFARQDGMFCEASAKPPRSHRCPTSMLRPFEAQPCSLVLKLNISLIAFHRPLSHGLNLNERPNVSDVCGTSILELRRSPGEAAPRSRSLAAKPREANPSHEFWPREAPEEPPQQCINPEPLKKQCSFVFTRDSVNDT